MNRLFGTYALGRGHPARTGARRRSAFFYAGVPSPRSSAGSRPPPCSARRSPRARCGRSCCSSPPRSRINSYDRALLQQCTPTARRHSFFQNGGDAGTGCVPRLPRNAHGRGVPVSAARVHQQTLCRVPQHVDRHQAGVLDLLHTCRQRTRDLALPTRWYSIGVCYSPCIRLFIRYHDDHGNHLVLAKALCQINTDPKNDTCTVATVHPPLAGILFF